MKTDTEIGEMQPRTKEQGGLWAATRSWERRGREQGPGNTFLWMTDLQNFERMDFY